MAPYTVNGLAKIEGYIQIVFVIAMSLWFSAATNCQLRGNLTEYVPALEFLLHVMLLMCFHSELI